MLSDDERQRLMRQIEFEHAGDNLCRRMQGQQPTVLGSAYALVSPTIGTVCMGWTTEPIDLSGNVEWTVTSDDGEG